MTNGHKLRTFYTILLTQAFSELGSQMTGLAVAIWLYTETGEVTPLATISAINMLPRVLLANFSGWVADRFDRRLIMALADTGAALCTLILLGLLATGVFQIWHLYVLAFIQQTCGAFQNPAYIASITMLVSDKQRERANAVMQLTGPMAGLFAPALTGILYAIIRVTGIMVFDLFTFAVAVTTLLLVHIPRPAQTAAGKARSGSFLRELTGGFSYLWQYKPLLALMLGVALVNFVAVGFGSMQTPYLLARTGSEITLGLIFSAGNVGAIVGDIIIGAWGGTRPRIHTIMPSIIGFGLCLALFGLAQTPITLAAALFAFMACPMFVNVSIVSMFQAKVAPDIQGRVFAVLTQVALVVSPIGPLIVGPLADRVFEPAVGTPAWAPFAPLVGGSAGAGMGLLIVIGGILMAGVSLFIYVLPAIRHMEASIPDYVPIEAETAPEFAVAVDAVAK
ncbi:MAG: MFS transporter [Anaerolineae bacterium]|nr:MFS transporter [Anaerolineae bacterium]